MSTAENKQRTEQTFSELAKGNAKPFAELLCDDIRWTVTGTTSWSKTYVGKQALRDELFRPLRAALTEPSKTIGRLFLADGDYVVVEGRGDNVTKRGERYDNNYCLVMRFREGRVQEVTEYLDTELTTRVLGARVVVRAEPSADATR